MCDEDEEEGASVVKVEIAGLRRFDGRRSVSRVQKQSCRKQEVTRGQYDAVTSDGEKGETDQMQISRASRDVDGRRAAQG